MKYAVLVAILTMGCERSGDLVAVDEGQASGEPPTASEEEGGGSENSSLVSGNSADVTTEPALEVGKQAPDFEVETLGGEMLRLSSLLGETSGPIILLFDRANW